MALERAYPVDIQTIYPVETDLYLRGLESVDTFKTPNELATKVPDATVQIADQAIEAVRQIEVARRRLSYFSSVFYKVVCDYPEAVDRLPEEYQGIIRELASRSILNDHGGAVVKVAE